MDTRHFVGKPKSASKIRLIRWPALLKKPLANYTVRWPADRNRLASGLPITRTPGSIKTTQIHRTVKK